MLESIYLNRLKHNSEIENKIEFNRSHSGLKIIKLNEHYLCSRRDPIKEASIWTKNINPIKNYCIHILGLGCGYHILSALQSLPDHKFFVWEMHQELIEIFKKTNSNCDLSKNLTIISNLSTKQLYDDPLISYHSKKPGIIYLFFPACQTNINYYNKLLLALTSRGTMMLNKNIGAQTKNESCENSISSIHNIINELDHIKKANKPYLIWKIARGLVK